MLKAYDVTAGQLTRLEPDALDHALWIDLCQPRAEESAAVAALGIDVPTLADMEEIEVSNRLYRQDGADYMTAVIPGHSGTNLATLGPVTFILSRARLVTVRHHAARPFETYAGRAHNAAAGCGSPARIFLGLVEEIIGRQADLLESVGRSLDEIAAQVFDPQSAQRSESLQENLKRVGRDGELISRIRLGLMTLNRALGYFGQNLTARDKALTQLIDNARHDLHALEVHTDALSARIALATDTILGLINLAQNGAVRIISVVAALFLPPTLIASIYGMNFRSMPELEAPWGYHAALGAMAASAILTWAWFKWKKWL